MPLLGEMTVRLGADISQFQSGVGKAKGELAGLKDSAGGAGGGIKGMLGNMLSIAGGIGIVSAAGAAFGALTGFVKDSVTQASQAQTGLAQTMAVIKSTGGAAGISAEHVDDLSNSLSQVTPFADDTVRSTENMLLTFTNIGSKGGIFDQTTKTALDMAQALGTDSTQAAMMLGKALNDPAHGMSALQRVGVTFTQSQKDAVAAMLKTGNTAGAQSIILKELGREFGGSAEAAGDTFAGKMQILNNKFDQTKQAVGGALIPIIMSLMTAVQPLVSWIGDKLPDAAATLTMWFGQYVSPVLHQVSAWFTGGGLDSIEKFAGGIVSGLLPVVATLAGWFIKDGLPLIKQFAGFVVTTVVPAVVQLGQWLVKNLVPVFLALSTVVKNDVIPGAEKIAGVLFANLIPTVQKLWAVISPVLIPALRLVGWIFSNVVVPAIVLGINIFGGVVGAITTVLGWLGKLKDIVGDVFGFFGNVVQTEINTAKNVILGGINAIVGFFSGMHIQFPHIPLPHFSIQGSFSLTPPSVPHLAIDWYAKGAIFNGPQVIGVGEAGPEAVAPISELQKYIGGGGRGGYDTANIYVMVDGHTIAAVMGQKLVDEARMRGAIRTA